MAYAAGCLFFAGALLHLAHFVFEHTDYLIAHGFFACRAEMNVDFVCGLSYALHKIGLFGVTDHLSETILLSQFFYITATGLLQSLRRG